MAKWAIVESSKAKLGRLIAKERQAQGLTQDMLAFQLKVSVDAVRAWEQGRSAPTARLIRAALKRVLGLDIEALLRAGELSLERASGTQKRGRRS